MLGMCPTSVLTIINRLAICLSTSYRYSGLMPFAVFENAVISSVLYFVWTRTVEAGWLKRPTPFIRSVLGRIGLETKPPPQLGQTFFSRYIRMYKYVPPQILEEGLYRSIRNLDEVLT
jgi:hypothetical protein